MDNVTALKELAIKVAGGDISIDDIPDNTIAEVIRVITREYTPNGVVDPDEIEEQVTAYLDSHSAYVPTDAGTDSSWWASKNNKDGGQKSAKKPDGSNYVYMESDEGLYTPMYTNCDMYEIGILGDGTTNNTNAKKYNQIPTGNLMLGDGMYVAKAGGQSGQNRWHSYDNNTGGHVFEGWSKDGKHRVTMLLNEPKRDDGMKEAALFDWDRRMNDFGWLRLGCDGMYTLNADGTYSIKDNDKEGLAVTRTFAIAHTPMQFEPRKKPVYMPEFVPNGLQTDSTRTPVGTGTVYFDESDSKLKIKIGNKWYNFLLEEDTASGEDSTPTVVNVTGVTLNKSTSSVRAGDTETLTATVAPSNATNKTITWSTSDSSVATVNNGFVSTLKAGTVTITATSHNGKTASCVYTVSAQSSGGGDTPTPDEPDVDGVVLPASKTGLSQDYTITDGNSNIAVFKWDENDYIVTSNRAIGYNGGQFRARSGIPANVYANGTLTAMTGTETNLGISWGIDASTIKSNHNMIHYTNDSSADDSAAAVTFAANYDD